MLRTPLGTPACWQRSAKRRAVSEVYSAGFRTTVLPMASAGATFQASIRSGKFQGMICPQTPSGALSESSGSHQLGVARVVIEVPLGQGDVEVAALADGLAVVERLGGTENRRGLLCRKGRAMA
jgi:hypothetical protein